MPLLFVPIACVLLFALTAEAGERRSPAECTYELQVWNVDKKKSTDIRKVRQRYDEVARTETDPLTGCTICSEDQVEIHIPPLAPFSVCYQVERQVRSVIEELLRKGAEIMTVTGYRVIKSRGPVDGDGNRTGLSNHSFGTALDINMEMNGLYDDCVFFGPHCTLLRGGEWRPGMQGALVADGDIVRAFKAAGFKWGGEIAGKQKDFMHFSLTGY